MKEEEEKPCESDHKPSPHNRQLAKDPNDLFSDDDAANAIKQMFGYLWENKDVFDAFSEKFLFTYCEEKLATDPAKVDQMLDLVVHRLFTDLTDEVPDYRVVTVVQRFIKQVIDKAETVSDVMHSPLLHKLFAKLTESNEARRCLHYLFRSKCDRIDTSFFTVKNLQRTYQRYRDIHYEANGWTDVTEERKDSSPKS